MSRFRRIGLAATAAAAVLALAVPTGASAISINSSGPTPFYTVTGNSFGVTSFMMPVTSTGGTTGVICFNSDNGMPISGGPGRGHGWGLADGQARTLFVPAFQQPHPAVGGGCVFVDADGTSSPVSIDVTGALALELTGLTAGQNPSSPQRKYNGRLFFYEPPFVVSFVPAKYPGCSVRIDGPQSANLYAGRIEVDDNADRIDMNVSGTSFAVTKTAACPSTIGDVVRIHQPYGGWRLNNVTVTP